MRNIRHVRTLLLFLLTSAFAVLAPAAFNVVTTNPKRQLALATVCFVVLAAMIAALHLATSYWQELFKRYDAFLRLRRGSRLSVPNLITGSRAALAGCVAVALIANDVDTAYQLYLAGLATDVLDGMVARSIDGATDWGKRFDAQVDVLFNGATGLAFFWLSLRNGNFAVAITLALLLGLFVVRLVYVSTGLLPKYFSGFVRVVFFVLFLALVSPSHFTQFLITGAGLLLFGAWYEQRVMTSSLSRPSNDPEAASTPPRVADSGADLGAGPKEGTP